MGGGDFCHLVIEGILASTLCSLRPTTLVEAKAVLLKPTNGEGSHGKDPSTANVESSSFESESQP